MMDLTKMFSDAIGVLTLKKDVIDRVSKDSEAMGHAWILLIVAAILSAIGSWLGTLLLRNVMPGFGGIGGQAATIGTLFGSIIFGVIGAIVAAFIAVGILWLVAKIFGGTGEYMTYFKTLMHIELLAWIMVLSFIPLLGGLLSIAVGIWALVAAIVVTQVVHKLSTGKAIATVLIPAAIIFLAVVVLLLLAAATMLAAFGLPMMGAMA